VKQGNSYTGFIQQLYGEGIVDLLLRFTAGVVETDQVASSFTFVMIGSDGRRRYLHHVGANAVFTDTDVPDE